MLCFSFSIPPKDENLYFQIVANTIVSDFHWYDAFLLYHHVLKLLNYYIKEKTMTEKKVLRLTETVAGSG